jgi:hypothetical protein
MARGNPANRLAIKARHIVVRHPTGSAGSDELLDDLGDWFDRQEVKVVGLVEAHRVGKGGTARELPSARPFLDGGCQRHAMALGCLLAVTEQFHVALGDLVDGTRAVRQPDARLLGDHPRLVHRGEDPSSSSPAFLPSHRMVGVAIRAVDRVDADRSQSSSDFDDLVGAFLLPGHRPGLSSQLVWNSVWKAVALFGLRFTSR